MSWGAIFVYVFCGCIAGYAISRAQINLRRTKKLLLDAEAHHKAALIEFERWRKAAESLEQRGGELKFGKAVAGFANLDPFKRPPGCLCREVTGGALKIEDFCPAHNPPARELS